MVVSIVIVILGALLIAASVLLRPKMPPKVANIVLIVAICIILIGGILLFFAWDQAKEDACNVYMALRYLEQDEGDASWYYLRRTPSDSFDSIAAGVAMEQARGNTGDAKDKLHELEDRAHLGQKDTVKQLQALLDGERFSILLSHRPERVEDYAASGFDLVAAGHAHGGQVRIPGLLNGLLAPNQGLFPKYAGGLYDLGGTELAVSRGLSINPLLPRVFNPPEIVVVEILPA